LPVGEVLAQAAELLADEPEGVVQVVGELRAPEVTRFLIDVARRQDLPVQVRARAAGAVEANEAWEREALVALVGESREDEVRVAAVQAVGASASLDEVLDRLGPLADDPSPALRGAQLWSLQLAARTSQITPPQRARLEKLLRRALDDTDAFVR